MPSRRRRQPVEEVDVFVCLLCDGGLEVPGAEYKAHRENVHGLTEHKGTRVTIMHADTRDYFLWAYEWRDADGKVFATQTTKTPRYRDRGLWEATDADR